MAVKLRTSKVFGKLNSLSFFICFHLIFPPYFFDFLSPVAFLVSSLTASDNLQFQFATDGEGTYGFLGADGSLIPFKRSSLFEIYKTEKCGITPYYRTITFDNNIKSALVFSLSARDKPEQGDSYVTNFSVTNCKSTKICEYNDWFGGDSMHQYLRVDYITDINSTSTVTITMRYTTCYLWRYIVVKLS